MKKTLYAIWEIVEVFLIAIIAVAAIKYFLIQPFIVNGASMEPNFSDGNYLLIDEISYRLADPQRGDVVVFRAPTNQSIYYIKRVIGLPGEKIEITSDKVIITNKEHPNGAELQEPYLESALSPNPFGTIVMTLKDSEYFVMGDNRSNSLDSRRWGPLVRSDIVGAVRLRLWPVSQLSFLVNRYMPSNTTMVLRLSQPNKQEVNIFYCESSSCATIL